MPKKRQLYILLSPTGRSSLEAATEKGRFVIKPLWALAGVALVGTAGVAGALVVASSGGEEEVVQQVETATPAASAQPSPDSTTNPETPAPSPSPGTCDSTTVAEGSNLWRWGDVTVQIPADSDIRAGGTTVGYDPRPAMQIPAGGGWGYTLIDAETGAIISQEPKGDYAAEIDSILATLDVCPLDRSTAPWPYNGTAPDGARQSIGYVSLIEPNPSTGIQVLAGKACGVSTQGDGRCRDFLEVKSAQSTLYIDATTGEVIEESKKMTPEDEGAFQRLLATVEIQRQ